MPAVVADPGSTPGRPNPPRSTPAGLLEGAGRIEGLSPPGASEGRPAGDAGTPDGGRVRPPPFDGFAVSPGFAGAGRMLGAAGVREGVPGLTRVGGRVSGVLGLSTLGRPVEGGIVGVASLGRVGLVWIGRDGLGCEGLGLGATGRTSGRGAGEGGAAAGREGRSPCDGSVRGRAGAGVTRGADGAGVARDGAAGLAAGSRFDGATDLGAMGAAGRGADGAGLVEGPEGPAGLEAGAPGRPGDCRSSGPIPYTPPALTSNAPTRPARNDHRRTRRNASDPALLFIVDHSAQGVDRTHFRGRWTYPESTPQPRHGATFRQWNLILVSHNHCPQVE